MPLQNRVLPTGEIVIDPARGGLTGNRGIIHRPDKTLGVARWSHKAWICCTLDWQGRRRSVMTGRNWTELFFLDEVTALAAGHRPCGYCRRQAYLDFVAAWTRGSGTRPKAPMMDKALHAARVNGRNRTQIRHQARAEHLPDGVMALHDDAPHLLWNGQLIPYTTTGYAPAHSSEARDSLTVLTPVPTISVLRHGYAPQVHPSAGL
ncbi:hypothetical protein [Yoonia sp. SS1-5]|uniref:Uncharacterized protein n=1 Tax=Yoonia rhodophyticola TaxID=3137370 RepID=A0AAN0M7C9_9RHOB